MPSVKEQTAIDSTKKSYVRLGTEIVGMLSIAASLIFVGVQLQQDRLIAQAEQFQGRTEITSENFRTFLEGHDVLGIRVKARSGAELTEVEEEVRQTVLDLAHLAYQNQFFQHQLGLMDDDTWSATRGNLTRDMQRLPGFGGSVRLPNPSYIELLDEIAKEISTTIPE